MKRTNTHNLRSVLITSAVVLAALIAFGVHGTAGTNNTISITVNNGTQRPIVRLYVAVGDPDNWGPDQLNGSTIPSGGAHVLDNVSCNGSTVRVIAEDQSGCFVYYNAACGANQTWAISSETAPDCGGS